MTAADLLVVATPGLPLLLAVLAAMRPSPPRAAMMLPLAPLPALLAAVRGAGVPALVIDPDRLRLTLGLDPAASMLLGAAALLWVVAAVHAADGVRRGTYGARFATCWLLSQAGCFGCFVSGDLPGFYLFFTLASLPAYALVIETGAASAWRAGAIYLGLAIGGEVCQLFAFAVLAGMTQGESLAIADAVRAMPAHPARNVVTLLLLVGFGLKAGLVPLHVWLPLAHPAAPAPASAVLSGTIIKAGVIGLIRFMPPEVAAPAWGWVLVGVGLTTAFYGVLVGILQDNPKTVLAYSSVSQMGVVGAILGAGIATADGTAPLAAAFYAAHHTLAKGAMFLAVAAAPRGVALLPALLIAAGFGGLPPTGGYLAKLAAKPLLAGGLLGAAADASAIGSTALMLHVVRRLAAAPRPAPDPVAAACWLVAAAASVAVPWLVSGALPGALRAEATGPAALLAAAWPVAAGAALHAVLARAAPRLPRIPEGDILLPVERRLPAPEAFAGLASRLCALLEPWAASGLALLLVTLALWAALAAAAA
jgi:formate hydrogenlyase subunit 3/multisubunit Na+/H+ antiporter MnhD subunit